MDSVRESCLACHSEPTVRVANETIDSIESFHLKKNWAHKILLTKWANQIYQNSE